MVCSIAYAVIIFLSAVCVLGIVNENSPLDLDDGLHLNMGSFESRTNQLPYVVDKEKIALPVDCSSQCYSHLFATLRSALEGSTSYVFKDFHGMCRNYENTIQCLHGVRECPTIQMYNTLTSGLKYERVLIAVLRYMCTEQRDAIEAMLPCVNQVFPTIQPACERSCQTERMAAGLTMKQIFQEDIKLLKILDQHMGRLTGNEACRISQCMLRCYRTRMNVRCDGAAGSVLTEGLIRPYVEVHDVGSVFMPLVANIIPIQCRFLTDMNEMREFRIDPNFDQHIRKKYSDLKKIANAPTLQQPMNDPFQNITMEAETSPLDTE